MLSGKSCGAVIDPVLWSDNGPAGQGNALSERREITGAGRQGPNAKPHAPKNVHFIL